MPYKDPEKRREKQREASRRFYEKHKEKLNQKNKEWRENNKEKRKEYRQSPQGMKTDTIYNWKRRGLIHDNYEELYEIYITTERCDVCKKEFSNNYDRCMDHNHETGLYRHILCRGCNTMDSWKNKVIQ